VHLEASLGAVLGTSLNVAIISIREYLLGTLPADRESLLELLCVFFVLQKEECSHTVLVSILENGGFVFFFR
jgi:hypothetical protein